MKDIIKLCVCIVIGIMAAIVWSIRQDIVIGVLAAWIFAIYIDLR